MARVEGKRHIFDVIKVNMFGVKQPRIIVIEQGDAKAGKNARLQICTGTGKVRRDLDISEISGVEEAADTKVPEDAERSVTFKFFEGVGASKEAKRTILFVSKRQRDAFVEEMAKMNPKLVIRNKDGTLGSAAEAKKKDSVAKHTKKGAKAVAEAADEGAEAKFFCMEENEWGFPEPRVVTFTQDASALHVVDATAAGTASSDYPLKGLRFLALHAGDKTAMALTMSEGDPLRSAAKQLVFTFGSKAQRDRFVDELKQRLATMPDVKYDTDDLWYEALPTKQYQRFEVIKHKPRKVVGTLMVSTKKRKIYVIRSKEIPGYETSSVIPNNVSACRPAQGGNGRTCHIPQAPVDEVVGVTCYRLQIERHPRNPRVLYIADAGWQFSPSSRDYSEIEFVDGAERERFCGHLCQMATPDDTATGGDGNLVVARQPAGVVRSTARLPSVVDMAGIWSQSWPHDDVKIWVGTYNVSALGPPADATELDKWLPTPSRDPQGPRDVYVVGMQELGTTSNREAWGQALHRHLALSRTGDPAFAGTPSSPAVTTPARPASASTPGADTDLTYVLVDYIYMWEMALWVFMRAPHVVDVTNVVHGDVPTGVKVATLITGVQLGNKGGIGIGVRWRETTIAFVLLHLPARPDLSRLHKREKDYKAIVRKLKLESAMGGSGMDFIHAYDHVILFGDLNYRVDLPFDKAVTLYKQRQYAGIIAQDQMLHEQGKGRVFVGFSEGRIDFPPSYRWDRKREEFSWKRGQAPSYTDRILQRSLPGLSDKLVQTGYDSATFLFGSDHRPVSATYTLSLRRYYSAPTMPLYYTPYPVPSFYSQLDASILPIPVVLLTHLRFAEVSALNAPAAIYLKLYAPWLDGNPIVTPTMAAVGPTPAQKEQLRALRIELEEDKRREAQSKSRAEKKEIKARADKDGPKVTVQGDPNYISANGAAQRTDATGGGFSPEASSPDAGVAGPDSDDDEDDEEEEGDDYSILDVDASSVHSGHSEGTSSKRKLLLSLQVEYCWTPPETAIPPLRPAVWDPRLLRSGHIHVVAHAAANPDGTTLCIGCGRGGSDGTPSPDAVVGQAVAPLLPMIRAAASAMEVALQIQAEDDEDDEVDKLLDETQRRSTRKPSGVTEKPKPKAEKEKVVMPSALSLPEMEAVAATEGIVDTTPAAFARAFNPDGIPWSLTAPPVGFRVDMEFTGQIMGKLSGQAALRANIETSVARRGQGPGALTSSNWNYQDAFQQMIAASATRKEIAASDGKPHVTFHTIDKGPDASALSATAISSETISAADDDDSLHGTAKPRKRSVGSRRRVGAEAQVRPTGQVAKPAEAEATISQESPSSPPVQQMADFLTAQPPVPAPESAPDPSPAPGPAPVVAAPQTAPTQPQQQPQQQLQSAPALQLPQPPPILLKPAPPHPGAPPPQPGTMPAPPPAIPPFQTIGPDGQPLLAPPPGTAPTDPYVMYYHQQYEYQIDYYRQQQALHDQQMRHYQRALASYNSLVGENQRYGAAVAAFNAYQQAQAAHSAAVAQAQAYHDRIVEIQKQANQSSQGVMAPSPANWASATGGPVPGADGQFLPFPSNYGGSPEMGLSPGHYGQAPFYGYQEPQFVLQAGAASIMGRGATAVAPQFQAFFEAQFQNKLEMTEGGDGTVKRSSAHEKLRAKAAAKLAAAAGSETTSVLSGDISDEEEDDEHRDDESMQAARAQIELAKKRAATRAAQISKAIEKEREKSAHLTDANVVGLWMPSTASVITSANVKNNVTKTLQRAGAGTHSFSASTRNLTPDHTAASGSSRSLTDGVNSGPSTKPALIRSSSSGGNAASNSSPVRTGSPLSTVAGGKKEKAGDTSPSTSPEKMRQKKPPAPSNILATTVVSSVEVHAPAAVPTPTSELAAKAPSRTAKPAFPHAQTN